MAHDLVWWKHGVIYQIYPRSFMDSDGDGIGDLQGVIDRLDYLNDGTPDALGADALGADALGPDALGIDAIWFSPTYPSPMKDFGYDVSDYTDVHPHFGDLATMDRLIAACHARGIKVILDYVPNHTSDQHPWFIEARAGRENPKRDWYLWADPKPDGSPPSNWIGFFGGSTWQWDAASAQYYLHLFLKEQPDLNWRNPAVVAAMHDVLRFWIARGVDGFRMDVVGMIHKDPHWRDNPPNPDARPEYGEADAQLHLYNVNQESVFEEMRALRRVLDEFPDTFAVGEVFGSAEVLGKFHGGERLDGLHMAFNFGLIRATTAEGTHDPWEAACIRRVVDELEAGLPRGVWPNYVLGNHDVDRLISRISTDGGDGAARARVAALLLLTLRGTPFIYYGEEIGMTNVAVPEAEAQDPARFRSIGRDPERTPMPWDGTLGRGFTRGTPWLPFGDSAVHVAAQTADPASLLALYRRLLRLGKGSDALRFGSYRPLDRTPDAVYAYVRESPAERLLIVLNFSAEPQKLTLPSEIAPAALLLSTAPERAGAARWRGRVTLAGNEGLIVALA